MEQTQLQYVVILLGVAVLAVTVLRRFRLPTILAYLMTGVVVGPHGLGWITDMENIRIFAEFGVVFLLFTLGLEFSLPRLVVMKKEVLVLGGAQVTVTTAAAVLLSKTFGISNEVALVIGGAFAMSSTAIVAKQLGEQLELGLPHGTLSVGILLFQDIAVVPFLILIASLTGPQEQSLTVDLLLALAKGGLALLIVLAVGRWLLRPLLHEIAGARSAEVFTLAVLLLTLTAAWTTHYFGLSLALGAFLAGMMLGETEFRHQVEADIRPFRDMLLGLFFVTIGMLINLPALFPVFHWVLAATLGIMLFKGATICLLSRIITTDWSAALRAGIVLAHGGEFGFAIMAVALGSGLIDESLAQLVLGIIVLSMFFSPLLIKFNSTLSEMIFTDTETLSKESMQYDIAHHQISAQGHAIICGYGRVGQNIARFLEKEGFEYIALDLDPYRVHAAHLAGDPVYYGDATHLDILKAAGLERARILIQTNYEVSTSLAVLKKVREVRKDIPVLVRTRDDSNLDLLQEAGATEVVPETLEASLMMISHVLLLLNVPVKRVVREIQEVRNNRYNMLRSLFRKQYAEPIDSTHAFREELHAITLPDNAHAVGKRIEDIRLHEAGIVITAIRRDGIVGRQPDSHTKLKEGDTLVIYGTPEDLEHAEAILLNG
ncbi:MAG: cation:proton antiporter [Gammaproteobacteria bacterium]|nr:cation:proton antiporter [Gammaproteobacteria bacterium]